MRGDSAVKDGQPPLIAADRGPVKVEPANPGGTEIPNQNKQIYERSAEAPQGKSKVVASEEQPCRPAADRPLDAGPRRHAGAGLDRWRDRPDRVRRGFRRRRGRDGACGRAPARLSAASFRRSPR